MKLQTYVSLQSQTNKHTNTMTTTQFILIAVSTFVFCFFLAVDANYYLMMQAAAASCGTDACISEVLTAHGFNSDIFADITTADKINALLSL